MAKRRRRQPIVERRIDELPERSVRRVHVATGIVLTIFAVTFLALARGSYASMSATWDEPIHVTAGYAALSGDFRVDPSHPPLLRAWAALPLAFTEREPVRSLDIDSVPPAQWLATAYGFAHEFLYEGRDADRLLRSGRFMIALLGLALGTLVFLWAREWLGFVPAVFALAAFTFEPNLLSHASLVTTDFGLTCFTFSAAYFAWRLTRRPGRFSAAALTASVVLAVLSKFSGVLVLPIVAALLALATFRRGGLPAARTAGIFAAIAVTLFAAIWAAYGFRYLPSAADSWVFALQDTHMAQNAPILAKVVEWVDSRRLLPNAFTQGFFYTHASLQGMPGFLGGDISESGWWYYFPVAFLLKTPLALLVLLPVGLYAAVRRDRALSGGCLPFVLVPVVVYFTVASASGVNLGLRHILPIYPFVILIAAAGASELMQRPRPAAIAAVALLAAVWIGEFGRAYPQTLTFFNHAVGGPANGYKYLSDSNLDWGQGLKSLKAWMDRAGVRHINLAYFGQADPAYYGINCTYLPGGPTFALDRIARPELPGYVAISTTVLSGVYAPPEWRLFYAPFWHIEPAAVIDNTIRIYRVERWPYPEDGEDVRATTHHTLARALLFGLQWPAQAVGHFERYLERRPDDADARVEYGTAQIAAGHVAQGVAAFQDVVAAHPDHGTARILFGKALFAQRNIAGAEIHAERAVALLPDDPDAHHLLGRVRAVQEDVPRAMHHFRRVRELQPDHPDAAAYLRELQKFARGGDPAASDWNAGP